MTADAQLPVGAPEPGSVFADKYRVERVLGVGGMGYVLAATHVHLNQRVAIKMLLPALRNQRDTVERFLREGRAAIRIKSEHVARVLDVGKLPDDTPYMVMEYLDGADLSEVLRTRGPLPYEDAVDYVLQACEAIAEAHAAQTIHRDLKPSNLFLTQKANGTPCVKVLDFGISKVQSSADGGADLAMTKTAAMLGSPLYMSPEQIKSARSVDVRTDIWALGVILFELIGGRPPFMAESFMELGMLILSNDTPWLSDRVPKVPEELSAVVNTCLRRKADERFATIADFAVAVAPFGSPSAAISAERIVQTIGTPAQATPLAHRGAPQAPISAPEITLSGARTLPLATSPSNATPWAVAARSAAETPPARGRPGVLLAAFGALAAIGCVGIFMSIRAKSLHAETAPSAAVSASTATVVAPASAEPSAIVATPTISAAPPVAASTPTPTPTPTPTATSTPGRNARGGNVRVTPASATAKPPPAPTRSDIATSSKD